MSEAATIDRRPESPAEALAALRANRDDISAAEIERFRLTLEFVAMNLADPGDPDTLPASYGLDGGDDGVPLAGAGAPAVSEFAVMDYAAALGMSTDAGKAYVGACMEVGYRLPRLHTLVVTGQLPMWRARRITDHTLALSAEAAAFVDRFLAPVAASCSWAQLDRVVEEAIIRHDPEVAEAIREAGADQRRFDVHTHEVSFDGIVAVEGQLDLADALDLDHAITARARQLARLGCEEPEDVRRSIAAGDLARHQPALDLPTADDTDDGEGGFEAPARSSRAPSESAALAPQPPEAETPPTGRELVLHVHLAEAAITGTTGGEVGRCVNTRSPISAEQIRAWAGHPDTQVTVKPVIDLNEQIHHASYEVNDRLREQTGLRDLTCVFPGCTRPAARCDRDHTVPYEHDGPTSTANIACLCRRHHRAKTHGGFSYRRLGPATYEWTTPHGYRIIRDHHGTHPAQDP